MVVDRTGLNGSFDFTLRWMPDSGRATTSYAVSDSPSLFTALQEQLGFRLEPQRGQVEFLVIDSVDRPTPD